MAHLGHCRTSWQKDEHKEPMKEKMLECLSLPRQMRCSKCCWWIAAMTDLPCTTVNTAAWKRDGFLSSDTQENSVSSFYFVHFFFFQTHAVSIIHNTLVCLQCCSKMSVCSTSLLMTLWKTWLVRAQQVVCHVKHSVMIWLPNKLIITIVFTFWLVFDFWNQSQYWYSGSC